MSETEASALVFFAAGLFDLDAIKKAAYRQSDRASVELTPVEGGINCILKLVAGARAGNLAEVERDFRADVFDYDLRAKIAKETEPVRNVVLSLAFSKTGLQG